MCSRESCRVGWGNYAALAARISYSGKSLLLWKGMGTGKVKPELPSGQIQPPSCPGKGLDLCPHPLWQFHMGWKGCVPFPRGTVSLLSLC